MSSKVRVKTYKCWGDGKGKMVIETLESLTYIAPLFIIKPSRCPEDSRTLLNKTNNHI